MRNQHPNKWWTPVRRVLRALYGVCFLLMFPPIFSALCFWMTIDIIRKGRVLYHALDMIPVGLVVTGGLFAGGPFFLWATFRIWRDFFRAPRQFFQWDREIR